MRKCFVLVLALVFLFLFVSKAEANNPPIADANGPYGGVVGEAVSFNGSGSFDPEEEPLSYAWDFGDGDSGTGESPSHFYSSTGIFTITLTVNDGENTSSPSVSSATILLPPPSYPIAPENEAEAIELNPDLTFTLEWEMVSEVEEYYYQFWKEGDPIPEEEIRSSNNISDPILSTDLDPGAKYFWHVKSCADIDGVEGINPQTDCSNYSVTWNFMYLLFPPNDLSFVDNQLPAKANWSEAIGAKSYVLDSRFDIGDCNWWDYILDWVPFYGWLSGHNCDIIKNFIVTPLSNWLGFGGNYDPSCPWILWDKENQENPPPEAECVPIPVHEASTYTDDTCVFVKNGEYNVSIASCLTENAKACGLYSGKIDFSVGNTIRKTGETFINPPPILKAPISTEGVPVVGKSHFLKWEAHNCSNFVHLFIYGVDGTEIINNEIPNRESIYFSDEQLKELFNEERKLNKEYTWKLQPCWRTGEEIRCENGVFSEEWHFKTIGAAPMLLSPEFGETVSIPTTLSWGKIDGAASYYYQVATDNAFTNILKEGATRGSIIKMDYLDILPDTQYWWRVKTCADEEGDVCGENWSEEWTFRTYPINPPTNLSPSSPNGTTTLPARLSWDPDPGANFYQYKIDYAEIAEEETLEGCEEKVGTPIVSPTVVSQPKATLYEKCLGKYQWWVRSCLDRDCTPEISTDWTEVQTFTAVEPPPPEEKGIVPCGRHSDNPDTPYNEREPCQLKHIGFMLQNILDFLLWRLGLIILGILAIVSAVTSYFSLGDPNRIAQIKAIWKSAGTGYGIILLAWLFINLLLVIFNFQAKFFGRWWELPF